ncbi:trigger factor [Salinibacterium sp. NSLL150]|uniref:trigger factor n=1 Tax=unclassified Salinibacterium TaxID=2632331 RepID=UPI0018CC7EC8|nr:MULTISPECIES: trigger factor [unclassified Salinibacterium]MBH0098802.1 trigger factor [Salinibacterium sp. NSLL35]MBH0101557.1 trigger factor [Salinibacterium sp. NSLL150]MBH0104316.1 trigger factor [Salinibacterium sp. NSLL16]MBH0107077.1 trigger factor [Salinibacterium sp. NSLL17]MBH0129328.1 trigger factor [Salinibacterium sp. NK8237]
MKTTVEKLSPTRVKLNISVTPEELKPSIDHAYGHIASQINIPGFRKGKVPPQLVDQRVGREEILNHAVSDGLDGFYRQAVTEEEIRVLGRPEADIVTWPEVKDFSGDLVLAIEVDVRPEFDMPAYDELTLTVEEVKVSADDVKDELDTLRARFGTLVTVERPATKGDFAQLDLVAKIGETEVDSATSISYELGSGELIEGIDEALDSLSAGESTTFESVLLGGDHEGETAVISVSLLTVKERELPEADDDFAQMASEFDTIKELKADLKEQIKRSKSFGQGAEARDQIVDELLKSVEIPVPEKLVEDEVHRHLENENRLEDDEHRAEVVIASEKTFRSQILLDSIVESEEIKVSQEELTSYLVQGAQQYGMEPGEFIQILDKNGQIPAMVAEVARSKALAVVLSKAKVVDTKGKSVDVSAFTAVANAEPVEEAPEVASVEAADDES